VATSEKNGLGFANLRKAGGPRVEIAQGGWKIWKGGLEGKKGASGDEGGALSCYVGLGLTGRKSEEAGQRMK